jgi:hypothetical protein
MGARSHLPRPLMRDPSRAGRIPRAALATLALVAATLAACFDFVEPDIPQAGAPATLQVSVSILDDGRVTVSAQLATGYDSLGVPRAILDPTLRVMGRELQPAEAAPGEARSYAGSWVVDRAEALGPIVIEPPRVEGAPAPPSPVWHGFRRAGPGVLPLRPGEDLALDLEVDHRGTAPIRQWFLQMTGAGGGIRLSADGPPPDRLVVPAIWLPTPLPDGSFRVTLTYAQSEGRMGPAGNYALSGSLSIRADWVVRRVDESE